MTKIAQQTYTNTLANQKAVMELKWLRCNIVVGIVVRCFVY